jgi:hypothetical protein
MMLGTNKGPGIERKNDVFNHLGRVRNSLRILIKEERKL